MNEATQRVIRHLKALAGKMFESLDDLAQRRRLLDEYFRVDNQEPEINASITPAQVDHIPVEWVCAESTVPGRRLLYIHGGSWISGSLPGYRALASRISEATRAEVLLVDYRLAPENKFPAGLNDCVKAWCWMLAHGPGDESRANRAFICGDSAGGNLTLASYLLLKEQGLQLPDGLIALSPATDFTGSSPSMQNRADRDPVIHPLVYQALAPVYLGNEDIKNPLVSPIYGDYRDAPPMLLQVGDAEVLLDDSVRLAKLARGQGCDAIVQVWKEMPHVFQGFAPLLEEANEAIESIAKFVEHHSG